MTTPEKRPITVSLIGKSGHAARLLKILQNCEDVRVPSIYYHKDFEACNLSLTRNFNDILSSDAIIIASPTPTHFSYLERLRDYPGYILVEKPAVSAENETDKLRSWPIEQRSRIMVNYNFRHSAMAALLREVLSRVENGKPVHFEAHTSHGLAFQEKYRTSWRGNLNESFGVMELVGVHYINLVLDLFGGIVSSHVEPSWRASEEGKGPPDSVNITLRTIGGTTISLFHSYAAPLANRVALTLTDGLWVYDASVARLSGPRNVFDKDGRFVSPPVIDSVTLDYAQSWNESLAHSINYFLCHVRDKKSFDPKDFEAALDTMIPIFKAKKQLL